jgi:hypothetical protein
MRVKVSSVILSVAKDLGRCFATLNMTRLKYDFVIPRIALAILGESRVDLAASWIALEFPDGNSGDDETNGQVAL